MAEVVGAEVRFAGAFERRGPDTLPPVLPAKVAALRVGEDERAQVRPATREVKLGELCGDGSEELRLTTAGALRRHDLAFGKASRNAQPRTREASFVEEVAPLERKRLTRTEPLVSEHAHERRVGAAEADAGRHMRRVEDRGANSLNPLGFASVDRGVAQVRQADRPRGRIRRKTAPLDGPMEDPLQDGEAAVDRGHAGAGGAQLRPVLIDRLTRDVSQAESAEVGAATAASTTRCT